MIGSHRSQKLPADFFVGNICHLCLLIVGKIAQMNQQRQNIIFIYKADHVIFKRGNHDRNCGAGKHLQNCCFQSVKIHIDKRNHRIVCARLRPIALECPIQKQTCHRVWIVYMVISKQIAVVPSSDFLKILSVFLTESGNFIFCESNIGSQRAWIQHGILMKII